jgi:hypothetical protein
MAYRAQRQTRYLWLIQDGFLRFEAQELSGVRPSEAPYLRQMRIDRRNLRSNFMKEAVANKWSYTRIKDEWLKFIQFEYTDKGWTQRKPIFGVGRTKYQASPWAMLKFYRQLAIESGEYFPNPKKRVRRDASGKVEHIIVSKGNIAAQKRRAKGRIEARKGTPDYQRYLQHRRDQARRYRQKRRNERAA